ncbi:hypothetical protein ASE63_25755 [Bosea sp. Root381]|uniref:hypothetical protein n=1 Tax=Bosea sp. Root381 TaxID=1736524 RepID=UPI0006F1CB1F|nr:hypothetical protein [Bosea sp. Root381]KRE04234.1 hypothetical protein ASE63_25755 [Bosea sp. Root381]
MPAARVGKQGSTSAGGDIHKFSQSVSLRIDVAMRDFVMRGQCLSLKLGQALSSSAAGSLAR